MKGYHVYRNGIAKPIVVKEAKEDNGKVTICKRCGLHDKVKHPRRRTMCFECGREYEREAKERGRRGKNV